MCGTRLLPFCSNAARDFELPGRSEALGMRVMAATSHPLATLTALDVLRRGGNAMDAAVAAIALLGVVEAPQTGIGGDCFVLYMPGGEGEVIALNGSGWAPAAASLDRCLARGMKSIPSESADAVTVPGAVAAWARLIADHGTMKLAELLQPAIAAAEDGYPVSERVARDWARQLEKLRKNQAAASIFLPNGAAPRPGDIHRQQALAAALKSIAMDRQPSMKVGSRATWSMRCAPLAGATHWKTLPPTPRNTSRRSQPPTAVTKFGNARRTARASCR
jgi:gamma-glutamyltranspeptidase / glutathione hydrolase